MAKIIDRSEIEPGYYWYSDDGARYEPVEIVKGSIYSMTNNDYHVWFIGSELEKNLKYVNGNFYGPIKCN